MAAKRPRSAALPPQSARNRRDDLFAPDKASTWWCSTGRGVGGSGRQPRQPGEGADSAAAQVEEGFVVELEEVSGLCMQLQESNVQQREVRQELREQNRKEVRVMRWNQQDESRMKTRMERAEDVAAYLEEEVDEGCAAWATTVGGTRGVLTAFSRAFLRLSRELGGRGMRDGVQAAIELWENATQLCKFLDEERVALRRLLDTILDVVSKAGDGESIGDPSSTSHIGKWSVAAAVATAEQAVVAARQTAVAASESAQESGTMLHRRRAQIAAAALQLAELVERREKRRLEILRLQDVGYWWQKRSQVAEAATQTATAGLVKARGILIDTAYEIRETGVQCEGTLAVVQQALGGWGSGQGGHTVASRQTMVACTTAVDQLAVIIAQWVDYEDSNELPPDEVDVLEGEAWGVAGFGSDGQVDAGTGDDGVSDVD